MMLPYRRRCIRRSSTTGFVTNAGPSSNGRFNFDRWNDFCPDGFHIKLAFNWTTFEPSLSVLLEFVNPTPDPNSIDITTGTTTDRRIILFDDSTTITSFVEDNLGTWWTLPQREKPDLPYEVWLTASGSDARSQTFSIDIAFFPNWPSQNLHGMLRRWAECGPPMDERRPDWTLPGEDIDPTTGQ